jgi:hypothetical protein
MWGALSAERTGLSLTIAAGPRKRSHSRVRAPGDSRPYFTVSNSSLPFSSPPTTRRVTVEVFNSASTRNYTAVLPNTSYKHFARTSQKTSSIVKNTYLLVRYLTVDVLLLSAYVVGICLLTRCLAMDIRVTM